MQRVAARSAMLRRFVPGGAAARDLFAIPDKSLPIIDLAYRLVLELNRAVGEFPRNQRPGLGRRSEEAAFDLLAALARDADPTDGDGRVVAERVGRVGANRQGGEVLCDEV